MSNEAVEGAPSVPTPRLVFDSSYEVPDFLRKDPSVSHAPKRDRDQDKPVNEIQEPEPAATIIADPVEQEPELTDTAETVEAPSSTQSDPMIDTITAPIGSNDDELIINTDLDELSVEDLKRHQEEVERKIREKQLAEKKAVIDQIVNVVNTYQIPVDELVEALGGLKIKRKGVKAKAKYQDPATGAIWSGRGKEPSWIKGKDRKPFEIPE